MFGNRNFRLSIGWVGIICFVVLILSFASAHIVRANPEANSLTVYGDQLAPQWSNGTTGASLNYYNVNPVEGGTRSIAVTAYKVGAIFRLNRSTPLDLAGYDTLRFWLHGGSSGGQQLRVMLVNTAGGLVNSNVIVTAAAGTGTVVEVPLANLGGLAQISGVALKNVGSSTPAIFYIDNLKLNGPDGATPLPTMTAQPPASPTVPAPTLTPPPPPANAYVATFDGAPAAPLNYRPANWDITVHSRDRETWYDLEPVQASHGAACDAPPASHNNTSYEGSVFQCNNHMMTNIRASGYGAIYMVPNQMVSFANGEAVIRFDISTLRGSNRDWYDLWITPYEDNLQTPLEDWLPDLNGEPRQAIHIRMEFGDRATLTNSFDGEIINNFVAYDLPEINNAGYETFLTPSASQRQTFELRISNNHIKFGMPAHNFYWIDSNISGLDWSQGIVQFGHHSYNPMKDCSTCYANTWHWDNITIAPAVPFTIIPANRRYVQPDQNSVTFATPAPADARLRFSGIGQNLEVSFNGGNSWQLAQMQAQEEYHEDHFRSYFMPIPAGTTTVYFRGQDWYSNDWHARDISIWSSVAPAGAPLAMDGSSSTLAWADFVPAAPEACHLPTEQQVAMLTTQ